MRRRTVLATLSTAGSLSVVGCSTGDRADHSSASRSPSAKRTDGVDETTLDSTATTATPRTVPDERRTVTTATPPSSPFPRNVDVVSVDFAALRSAFDVNGTVEVLDGVVTAGETARVALSLRTNVEDARELTYTKRDCSRNALYASVGDYDLFLFPAGNDYSTESGPTDSGYDCPVVSHTNRDCGIPAVESTVTVPSTGAVTWQFDLWVPPSNIDRGGCIVPGEYRFSREFRSGDSSAELSFTLRITAP